MLLSVSDHNPRKLFDLWCFFNCMGQIQKIISLSRGQQGKLFYEFANRGVSVPVLCHAMKFICIVNRANLADWTLNSY